MGALGMAELVDADDDLAFLNGDGAQLNPSRGS